MLEKQIEEKSCRWAVNQGWLQYKFTSPSRRSVPDRMFIREGRVVFIEFKTEKGRLTSGQAREIARLENADCEVHVCRSLDEVKGVLGGA